jgi:hypothetical protein
MLSTDGTDSRVMIRYRVSLASGQIQSGKVPRCQKSEQETRLTDFPSPPVPCS